MIRLLYAVYENIPRLPPIYHREPESIFIQNDEQARILGFETCLLNPYS